MNKVILVTGGAGFVGSHLCERLVKNSNYKVYSLDNYFTGSEKNHINGVTYIKGDTIDIEKLVDSSPDMIYHLGEYSRVEQSFDDMEKVWKYNKDGTFAILEFARKHGCKVLYAGSSTKFGDGGLSRNASPYAWTKATNTELVINYGNWYNIPYAITYFYNVYGPREISTGKYATLIALFKEKMRNNESLTIVSPGSQKRNFTHIDDIINGLILVGENGYGDEFGIGSPEAYSILEIAKMFNGKIEMLPERKGNRMTADVMTEKTEALGWKPTKSIKEYIEECRLNSWN
ncbi:NAD-dependent epimerase/dehydratase family protein [Aliarcobacter butzleri]|uniref:NAD-dependent epimerase/dehydratase family protein n=1 Tax=Aliarcobacter butzleri TaxID=28197 RepID=UPI001EDA4058|nr:NAD-dependent epimerase/dehydratase family protein [Aliarcobacter butzleri]MCG3654173.1 NAD-dependent epimerase/dehydratase family protein [Aliarcobacter butzleri]MCG3697536.1 NAD-dependent epimerase/dehydratase family protein [Aliarcobacter butzleri]MCG3698944.1 NAD-dependent epimerase/dehydratase family protein [Aliarcobacter butzleri]MCG3717570.1 NAD-dependent epimerase/dehydratase family protein [Aliarcobacter butzleri]MCT7619669.1 NAD-dependent epimerase/dehydratase family protein [Ali